MLLRCIVVRQHSALAPECSRVAVCRAARWRVCAERVHSTRGAYVDSGLCSTSGLLSITFIKFFFWRYYAGSSTRGRWCLSICIRIFIRAFSFTLPKLNGAVNAADWSRLAARLSATRCDMSFILGTPKRQPIRVAAGDLICRCRSRRARRDFRTAIPVACRNAPCRR